MSDTISAVDYVGKPIDCDLYEDTGDRVYLHHFATDTVIGFPQKWIRRIEIRGIGRGDGFAHHCKTLKNGVWEPLGPQMRVGNVRVHVHVENDTYCHRKSGHTISLDSSDLTKIDHYSNDPDEQWKRQHQRRSSRQSPSLEEQELGGHAQVCAWCGRDLNGGGVISRVGYVHRMCATYVG